MLQTLFSCIVKTCELFYTDCPSSPRQTYLFSDGSSCIYITTQSIQGYNAYDECQDLFGGDAAVVKVTTADDDAYFRDLIQR